MIFRAIAFAMKAHDGQYRKATKIPYIVHPLGVAKILLQWGCSEEVAVAGLLHDVVEDSPVVPEEIGAAFGERIRDWVGWVTVSEKGRPWEVRKQESLGKLDQAPLEAVLVACADKLDNLRSVREDIALMGEAVWDRFNSPKSRQDWYYRATAERISFRLRESEWRRPAEELVSEVGEVFGQGAC